MSRCEPKRDRIGRYLLPDPHTGVQRAYTRTTTLAKSISDTTGLDRWKSRQTLIGFARDLDLLEAAISAAGANPDDREALDHFAERALEVSGAGDAAQRGTDLHALTEALDAGEEPDCPQWAQADLEAYRETTRAAGLTFYPEWIERLVVNISADVAGTLDRIVVLPDGRAVIADLKTGQDLRSGWGEIAMQLAVYANADAMLAIDGSGWEDMPRVDHGEALVIHLPVGKAECSLYTVDIMKGWAAVLLAHDVREWRAQARQGLARVWRG